MFSALELHEIAEAGHRILNPFTDAQLLELGAVARVGPGTRILDLACGKGELLWRWAQEFGARGVGVDLSPVFTAAARERADELGVADRVRVEQGDAAGYRPEPGAFDVAAGVGATWIGDGVAGTVALLRAAVPPTGLLLIGEPFWREPPPADARAAYGDPDLSPTCRVCPTGSRPRVTGAACIRYPGTGLAWRHGPEARARAEVMAVTESWVATDACTLPSAEQPLRVAEFDALFGSALRRVERRAPDRLRLELDAGAESRARELVARETACCAFFDFRLTPAGDALLVDVRVPAARTDVLDGLARRAAAARG